MVQPIAMEDLLSSFAPPGQCFYYAHPRGENHSKGSSIGEFFGGDRLKLIGLSSDTAWMVSRFAFRPDISCKRVGKVESVSEPVLVNLGLSTSSS